MISPFIKHLLSSCLITTSCSLSQYGQNIFIISPQFFHIPLIRERKLTQLFCCFLLKILYKSNTPLADAINDGIRMNFGKHKNFGSFNTIFQIANVVYHKRGKQPRISADFLSHISEAFDLTSDQMSKSIVKMLKNIL